MQTTRANSAPATETCRRGPRDWTEHKVPLVSVSEQEHVVAELKRVSSASPEEQMQVINWAMQYKDHYYMTPSGSLRRVFPKGKLLRAKRSKHHATDQS